MDITQLAPAGALIKELVELALKIYDRLKGQDPETVATKIAAINAALESAATTKGDTSELEKAVKNL